MKGVKVLIIAAVAVAVGLLVYWSARRHPIAPTGRPPSDSASRSGSAPSAIPSELQRPDQSDNGPIQPPRTDAEKERDALESRRAPLYARLHQDLGQSLLAVRPSDDDATTLDLYPAVDSQGSATAFLPVVLRANVAFYGFRHIRFFAANPAQSIERYRLDAEASSDASGNWNTFKK